MKKPLTVLQVSLSEPTSGDLPDLSSAFEALRVGAGLIVWREIELVMVFEKPVARLLFPLDQLDRSESDTAQSHWALLIESKAALHTLSDQPAAQGLPPALSRKNFATLLSEANHLMRF